MTVSAPAAPVRHQPPATARDGKTVGMEEIVRRRVVVSGRVQGVFYRDSCQQMAGRLKVGGWVRNRADGSVEAAFEGSPEAVDQLIAWCRTGPRRAVVTAVGVTEEDPVGERTFRVEGW